MLSQGVKVVRGLPAKWETHFHEVSFQCIPRILAHGCDVIAVGLQSYDHNITILNTTMGIQTSILSGHSDWVRSLTFSLDGTLLVSGGDDKTIKLWNVETSRVVKTFLGHSSSITSVSISPDCTRIVSGSWDGIVCLWNISTEEHYSITKLHCQKVNVVSFSPIDPQHIISASEDGTVKYWSVDDSKNNHTYNGYYAAFSTNGTKFVSCGSEVITIQNSSSGETVTTFPTPANNLDYCCFSPDDQFMAGAASETIYIWNITNPSPYLIKTFTGHTSFINSLIFSSSLISASDDRTVKFWEIDTLLVDQVAIDPTPIPTNSASIESINIQASDGIAISSDSAGMVRVWDVSTGLCKTSFKTPARGRRDIKLTDGRSIIVWYAWKTGVPGKVHVWDINEGKTLQTFGQSWSGVVDLKISGDGSMVFLLDYQSIQAWSISTGELMGKVIHEDQQLSGLIVNGSRVWLSYSDPMTHDFPGSTPRGWDFGISGSPSILPPNIFPDRPCFKFVNGTAQNYTGLTWVEDRVTQRRILYFPKRFSVLTAISQWDKWCLVIGYPSGEVLILDFSHVYPK